MRLVLILTAVLLGCASDDLPAPTTLVWEPCGPRIAEGRSGECARVSVPLRWRDPDGPRLELAVKRLRAPGARGQLWVLDGGPGATGVTFEAEVFAGPLLARGWDIYLPTHRGTGESTPLSCPSMEAEGSLAGRDIAVDEAQACRAELVSRWGEEGLAGFSTLEAARDLAHLLALAADGRRVALYAGSYGTFLAQRYFELGERQVSAVVFDGAIGLGEKLDSQLVDAEASGLRLLALCGADAGCRARLGGDPLAAVDDALAALAAGRCPAARRAGLGADTFRALLRTLVNGDFADPGRALAPALVARVRRCDANDGAALGRLGLALQALAALATERLADPRYETPTLGYQVAANELWPPDADPMTVAARHEGLRFSSPGEAFERADLLARWPRGDGIPAPGFTPSPAPLLLLAGDLDTFTPTEWALRLAESLPGAHLVRFPTAGHGTVAQARLPDGGQCAIQVMLAFLETPEARPDAGCVAAIPPIDWAGLADETRELSEQLLGTPNLYD